MFFINWLKKFFKKFNKQKENEFQIKNEIDNFMKNETDDALKSIADDCFIISDIKDNGRNHFNCPVYNSFLKELNNFDKNKPSILIIDDNEGVVSFMKDDLESIGKEINIDKYNIISFSSPQAVYQFKVTQHYYDGLNIKYAIIDLTFGGIINTKHKIIKANGIDVYWAIKLYEGDDFKFIFYTGNSLNGHVKTTKQMIEKFKKYSGGENLLDYTLFKTSLNIEKRREILKKWFLDKNITKIKNLHD
jgi:CheY-like chemotaxis protein